MSGNYVKLWTDYAELFSGATDREVGRMIKAMLAYSTDGTEPGPFPDRAMEILWKALKMDMDIDQRKKEQYSRMGRASKRVGKNEQTDVAQCGTNVAQEQENNAVTTADNDVKKSSVDKDIDKDKDKDIDKDKDKDINIDNRQQTIDNRQDIYSPPEGGHPPETGHNVAHTEHKAGRDPCPWFEKAWEAYPRKEGKSRISRARKEALSKDGEEAVMSAIENYKKIIRKDGRERDGYVLMGSTFFNGRYRDYIDISEIEKPKKNLEDDDWNKGALIV